MTSQARLAVAVGSLLLAVLAAIAVVAGALWADLDAAERATAGALLEPRLLLAWLLPVIAAGAVAFVFTPFVRDHFAAHAKLAEEAHLLLGANRTHRVDESRNAELGPLAHTLNELANQRDALQTDVERQIRDSQAKLEEERNRLSALMSELAEGIVACNLDGRILLYNNRARLQFTALARGGATGSALIGLGRSIFSVIERPLIDHALDKIRYRHQSGGQRAMANFVTASRAGQLIRVQMAPVLGAAAPTGAEAAHGQAAISGYVLVLENITRSFEAESRRDQALHALTEGSRASLANIRAAVETLAGYPDMDGAERERFVAVIVEEVRALSERLEDNASQHANALKSRWLMEEMRGADVVAAAKKTMETRLGLAVRADEIDPALWVRTDSFTLIRGLTYLAARLQAEFGVREVGLRLTRAERLAQLDLCWPEAAAPLEVLQAWEHEPIKLGAEASPLTLHDVAERHGGEAWFQREDAGGTNYCRLLLPIAEPEPETLPRIDVEARPEYYDFALFDRAGEAHALDERPLTELTYTVFDTETTGLDPSAGDEIIQIGAARIVNLRLLKNETFDQLVDPRRRLDPVSARIHGITEDMLRGQPTIDEVLPAFHAFCEDTVLVGYNVAFDLRFLQLKEGSTGVRFDQPLLDALLLSEVIHPAQESHQLEAIAERLGVRIEARHNALADAMGTAEVFLRMIGLLADAGIRTLRQAREASAKTRYARVRY